MVFTHEHDTQKMLNKQKRNCATAQFQVKRCEGNDLQEMSKRDQLLPGPAELLEGNLQLMRN